MVGREQIAITEVSMALIECPDCGKQISDAAEQCIGCGRPMSQARASSGDSASRRDAMVCEACGSSDVRKFSVVHAGQSSTSSSKTTLAGAWGWLRPRWNHRDQPYPVGW